MWKRGGADGLKKNCVELLLYLMIPILQSMRNDGWAGEGHEEDHSAAENRPRSSLSGKGEGCEGGGYVGDDFFFSFSVNA